MLSMSLNLLLYYLVLFNLDLEDVPIISLCHNLFDVSIKLYLNCETKMIFFLFLFSELLKN